MEENINAAITTVRNRREYEFELCSRKAEQLIEEWEEMPIYISYDRESPTGDLQRFNAIIEEILRYCGYWCKSNIKKMGKYDEWRRVRYDLEEMTEEQRAIWIR
jgi:hypothetical protein